MRITSSSEYAMRLMVQLARRREGAPVPADSLAEHGNVPRDYVDQLLLRLRRAGLVVSHRGASGGYALAMPPEKINVADVFKAVDGRIFEQVCDKYAAGEHDCRRQGDCGLRSVWQQLARLVEDFLGKITLSQLLEPEGRVSAWVAKAAAAMDEVAPDGRA